MLFGERHVSPAEFTHVPAVPTQTVCANLCSVNDVKREKADNHQGKRVLQTHFATGVMPQVVPVNVKLAVIIHVYEFVCQSVFHVSLAARMVLA